MEAKQYIVLSSSASKRALFPSTRHNTKQNEDDDDDNDSLDAMPLDGSSPDRFSSPPPSPYWQRATPTKVGPAMSLRNNLSKRFDEVVQLTNTDKSHVKENIQTPSKYSKIEIVAETPEKPFTCSNITPFKGILTRVQNVEETPDSTTSAITNLTRLKELKNKLHNQNQSPKGNLKDKPKLDLNSAVSLIQNSFYKSSNCKARVSLFPESNADIVAKRIRSASYDHKVSKRPSYSTTHPRIVPKAHKRNRSSFGEINNGVFHKVRRPRPKKKRSSETPKLFPSTRVEQYIVKNSMLELEDVFNVKDTSVQDVQCNAEKTGEMQRELASPESEEEQTTDLETDPNKKFFKTNRTMAFGQKATCSIIGNVRLKVHKGKISLSDTANKNKCRRPKAYLQTTEQKEFDDDDDPVCTEKEQVQKSVQLVLRKLEDEIPNMTTESISLNIQNLTTSTSSLALEDTGHDGSQDPASTSEKMSESNTSKTSCQTPGNICVEELAVPVEANAFNSSAEERKLYPVFYKEKRNFDSIKTPQKKTPVAKRFRPIGDDQYQIDAGQFRFRAVQCRDCGVLYHEGDPEDELNHYNIHHNIPVLRFVGWKNEREIREYPDGKVIVVYPNDPKSWVKKAHDVLNVVDQELGFAGFKENLDHSKVYMYVKKKRIAGILVAEVRKTAYRMLSMDEPGPDCCTEETYPVKCGVSRIWTAPTDRRMGVATKLMDCMRVSFFFDHFLAVDEVAFSVPTDDGKAFVQHYTQTSQFMVYYR